MFSQPCKTAQIGKIDGAVAIPGFRCYVGNRWLPPVTLVLLSRALSGPAMLYARRRESGVGAAMELGRPPSCQEQATNDSSSENLTIFDLQERVAEAFPAKPLLLDAGECALVVEFGRKIDPEINDRVLALDRAITEADLPGVEELMPTYRSLMIHYDPLSVTRDELASRVLELASRPVVRSPSRRWIFPACYDRSVALDLADVAWSLSMSEEQIVDLHSAVTYRIYWHGFAPGLPALGGLPEELRLPRMMTPRPMVEEGSLIIAAGQASIASVNMPCGWYVIGRSPERLFVLERQPPILTRTGDEMVFERIDIHEFERLRARALEGERIARIAS